MRILQVNTADKAGGAESVAWQLFQAYRRRGHSSSMLVGFKRSQDPDIHELKHEEYRSVWSRGWAGLADRLEESLGPVRGLRLMQGALRFMVGQPRRARDRIMGREDFDFPATAHMLDRLSAPPDILHCHNLHGGWLKDRGFFDLSMLPKISRAVPTVVTLHDAWLLSGHCAHSFECDRWKTGCGECPDLTIYPSIARDGTAHNWRRKRNIYSGSRLFVATPSRWLMEKVDASILSLTSVERRVIPNGVDLSIFVPAEKQHARASLGLEPHANILLFAANGIKDNVWKDYRTLRHALLTMAAVMKDHRLLLLALGDEAETETIGSAKVQFVPYEQDPQRVALYYQAADVYLHAARADTYPNTVMEAAACGTPVIATAVGGIPEQIVEGRSGFLVPAGDPDSMARQARLLLTQADRHRVMSAEAAQFAKDRFDLARQVQVYLDWYEEILCSSARATEIAAHAS